MCVCGGPCAELAGRGGHRAAFSDLLFILLVVSLYHGIDDTNFVNDERIVKCKSIFESIPMYAAMCVVAVWWLAQYPTFTPQSAHE